MRLLVHLVRLFLAFVKAAPFLPTVILAEVVQRLWERMSLLAQSVEIQTTGSVPLECPEQLSHNGKVLGRRASMFAKSGYATY